MVVMIEQDLEITSNKEIAPGAFLMELRSPEIMTAANPGQFVMIRVRPGMDPLLRRPFSISGVRGDDQFLILYRLVGRGTSIMANIQEGEKLSVLGPLGRGFEIPERERIPILVAGGMGVAPLLFLAQTMKARKLHFMMGFGCASEMITMEEMGYPPMDVAIATEDGTQGKAGLVTDLLENSLWKYGSESGSVSVFACGPAAMLRKVAKITLDQGISCQVSLEASMACGLGACQGCAVKAPSREKRAYYHVCTDGPVFPVQSIDWDSFQIGLIQP
jgi:dihydroorotate dehydrogenase electron transfer subunit